MNEPQRRSVTLTLRGWLTAAAVFASAYIIWVVFADSLSALVLLFTGILFAAALRPMVERLRKRMPFGAAVGVAFGGVLLVTALICFILIAPLGAEVEKLVHAIPGYVSSLQDRFAAAQRTLKNDEMANQVASTLANSAGGAVGEVGKQILGGPALVAAIFSNLVLIILLAVGWMLSADDLKAFILGLMGPASREDWSRAFEQMGSRLSAYVQGVVLNGAVVGVAMGASLALIGIPYALLLGFVCAVLQAIPMVGAVISGLIVIVAVLATSGWTKMWIALGIFAVVQAIDQNALSPIIFGKRVQLSFLLIIFSTVIGGMLLGIAGAFLAVPAAAVLQVLVVQIVAPAIRRANGVGPESPPAPAESAN